jgi:hypothetical protein
MAACVQELRPLLEKERGIVRVLADDDSEKVVKPTKPQYSYPAYAHPPLRSTFAG